MADIDIRRPHNTTLAAARNTTERIVEQLRKDFDVKCRWEGNTVHFTRTGLSGELSIDRHEVAVVVKLSLLLKAFKGRLEKEMLARLDQHFG